MRRCLLCFKIQNGESDERDEPGSDQIIGLTIDRMREYSHTF